MLNDVSVKVMTESKVSRNKVLKCVLFYFAIRLSVVVVIVWILSNGNCQKDKKKYSVEQGTNTQSEIVDIIAKCRYVVLCADNVKL